MCTSHGYVVDVSMFINYTGTFNVVMLMHIGRLSYTYTHHVSSKLNWLHRRQIQDSPRNSEILNASFLRLQCA